MAAASPVDPSLCKVCGTYVEYSRQHGDGCCVKCGAILGILTSNIEKGQLRQQVKITVHKFPVNQKWKDAVTRGIEGLFEGNDGVDIVFDLRNYKVEQDGYHQKVLIKVSPRQTMIKSAGFQ